MSLIAMIAAAQNEKNDIVFSAPALKEAAAKAKAEAETWAATVCQELITNFTAQLKSQVAMLRQYRKQEAEQKAKVEKVDRSFRYFAATGNPLPMYKTLNQTREGQHHCQNIGVQAPALDSPLWDVPADFVPPTADAS